MPGELPRTLGSRVRYVKRNGSGKENAVLLLRLEVVSWTEMLAWKRRLPYLIRVRIHKTVTARLSRSVAIKVP